MKSMGWLGPFLRHSRHTTNRSTGCGAVHFASPPLRVNHVEACKCTAVHCRAKPPFRTLPPVFLCIGSPLYQKTIREIGKIPPNHLLLGTHTHTHTHTRMHARMHARTHTRTHPRTHARTHARTHPPTHAPTHPPTHTHLCRNQTIRPLLLSTSTADRMAPRTPRQASEQSKQHKAGQSIEAVMKS